MKGPEGQLHGYSPKLAGAITVWFVEKGYGFIVKRNDDEGTVEKFYLHISRILAGQPRPTVGAPVRFEVNPVIEGRLPSAINVEVIAPPTKEDPDAVVILQHQAKASQSKTGSR